MFIKKRRNLTAIAAVSLVLSAMLTVCPAATAVTVVSEYDMSGEEIYWETAAGVTAVGDNLEIKAKSAVLMEVTTGEVLYEQNPDEALPPASITKIMSLLLIIEAIERGDFSLQDSITVSEHAASMGGSQIWLEENESMSVDDLLKAAVIASANDATVALAEKVCGSEEGFVAAMNERALALGMNSTHFMNATGLDADGHITTANDVAIMSRELIKHSLIKKYSTVWMESLRGGETELVNTNRLIRFYDGATGLKTGTTSNAGYCLSATAEREGLSLVAVIMSGESSNDRFNGARKLLDYGFANYTVKQITPETETKYLPVSKGESEQVEIALPDSVSALMLKSEIKDISQKISLDNNLTAPIKKGQKVGVVEIFIGENMVAAEDITAAGSVARKTVFSCLKRILKGLFIL